MKYEFLEVFFQFVLIVKKLKIVTVIGNKSKSIYINTLKPNSAMAFVRNVLVIFTQSLLTEFLKNLLLVHQY